MKAKKSSRYLPKITTKHGSKEWTDSFAHQRCKMLKNVGVSEEDMLSMVNLKYAELPYEIRYKIETENKL